MYIKNCKWCEKDITVEKQCLFALHVCNCDSNPNKAIKIEKLKLLLTGKEKTKRIILKQNCPKCGDLFEIIITESQYKRNKYKKYCSSKCSHSKNWTEEHKKKLSETCKNSERVKIANKKNGEDRIKKSLEQGDKFLYIKSERLIIKEYICEHCGEIIKSIRHGKKIQKYHKECWLKISGGLKIGSSRSKHGWYKGYWCDSSYELAFLIYNLEHDIEIERNRKGYEYYYKNKKHKFYPDFRVDGKLVEIKNFRSELTDAKLNSVDEEIKIYYKDTIKPYINYVVDKYGKKFIELYEK